MVRHLQNISPDALLASLRDRSADGAYTVALPGGELPVWIRLRRGRALVFMFGGAVDRTKRTLPSFPIGPMDAYEGASVVAFADPSLAQRDDVSLAWYAGHDGFPLQTLLPDLLRDMVDAVGATRVVLLGGSGGGFAALSYAWHLPGSVALVMNPQTNIDRYHPGHRQRYRAACWPSLTKADPLGSVIACDVTQLYARGCDSTVVYLQEASDFFHLRTQFVPFAAALPDEYADRFTVRMGHWSANRGHGGISRTVWVPWLDAVLAAPDLSAAAIERVWEERNASALPDGRRAGDERGATAQRDELFAAALARSAAAALMSESTEVAGPELPSVSTLG